MMVKKCYLGNGNSLDELYEIICDSSNYGNRDDTSGALGVNENNIGLLARAEAVDENLNKISKINDALRENDSLSSGNCIENNTDQCVNAMHVNSDNSQNRNYVGDTTRRATINESSRNAPVSENEAYSDLNYTLQVTNKLLEYTLSGQSIIHNNRILKEYLYCVLNYCSTLLNNYVGKNCKFDDLVAKYEFLLSIKLKLMRENQVKQFFDNTGMSSVGARNRLGSDNLVNVCNGTTCNRKMLSLMCRNHDRAVELARNMHIWNTLVEAKCKLSCDQQASNSRYNPHCGEGASSTMRVCPNGLKNHGNNGQGVCENNKLAIRSSSQDPRGNEYIRNSSSNSSGVSNVEPAMLIDNPPCGLLVTPPPGLNIQKENLVCKCSEKLNPIDKGGKQNFKDSPSIVGTHKYAATSRLKNENTLDYNGNLIKRFSSLQNTLGSTSECISDSTGDSDNISLFNDSRIHGYSNKLSYSNLPMSGDYGGLSSEKYILGLKNKIGHFNGENLLKTVDTSTSGGANIKGAERNAPDGDLRRFNPFFNAHDAFTRCSERFKNDAGGENSIKESLLNQLCRAGHIMYLAMNNPASQNGDAGCRDDGNNNSGGENANPVEGNQSINGLDFSDQGFGFKGCEKCGGDHLCDALERENEYLVQHSKEFFACSWDPKLILRANFNNSSNIILKNRDNLAERYPSTVRESGDREDGFVPLGYASRMQNYAVNNSLVPRNCASSSESPSREASRISNTCSIDYSCDSIQSSLSLLSDYCKISLDEISKASKRDATNAELLNSSIKSRSKSRGRARSKARSRTRSKSVSHIDDDVIHQVNKAIKANFYSLAPIIESQNLKHEYEDECLRECHSGSDLVSSIVASCDKKSQDQNTRDRSTSPASENNEGTCDDNCSTARNSCGSAESSNKSEMQEDSSGNGNSAFSCTSVYPGNCKSPSEAIKSKYANLSSDENTGEMASGDVSTVRESNSGIENENSADPSESACSATIPNTRRSVSSNILDDEILYTSSLVSTKPDINAKTKDMSELVSEMIENDISECVSDNCKSACDESSGSVCDSSEPRRYDTVRPTEKSQRVSEITPTGLGPITLDKSASADNKMNLSKSNTTSFHGVENSSNTVSQDDSLSCSLPSSCSAESGDSGSPSPGENGREKNSNRSVAKPRSGGFSSNGTETSPAISEGDMDLHKLLLENASEHHIVEASLDKSRYYNGNVFKYSDYKDKMNIMLPLRNLYIFRTRLCTSKARSGNCENDDSCPYSHCLSWPKRDPHITPYYPILCPDLDFGRKVDDGKMHVTYRCRRGRRCQYSHTKEEQMYHPWVYKTQLCRCYKSGNKVCIKKVCPFAHGKDELRELSVKIRNLINLKKKELLDKNFKG